MNKFVIKTFKKFILICLLCLLSSNSFSNEFEIKAEKVNYNNAEGKIIAEGNALAFNQEAFNIL